ncbi:MAG TPA: hypothetical protein VEX68_14360 [Bryobacteraceae bacterium]|nr:hypothetical protein [Bryobacteraceae bacterium]
MRAASLFWTDNSRNLSVKMEQQTLDNLAAELRSGSSPSTSGVLLGTVQRETDWTRIEVGACLLLRSAPAVELRKYPPATPRAPGCVGYFSTSAIGQSEPLSHPFIVDSQVFLFVRLSDEGKLSPELYVSHDRALIPIPKSAKPDAKFVISKSRVWAACAALIGTFVVSWLLSSRPQTPSATTASERFTIVPKFSESSPFQLAVSREAGSLKLSWDARTFAIRSAQKGILVIEDGERNAQQLLDSDDLRSGQLVYVPDGASLKASIRFRMDLVSETGALQSASVRVLGSAPQSVAKLAVASSPPSPDVVRARGASPAPSQPISLPSPVPTEAARTPESITASSFPAPETASAKPLPVVEPQPIERAPVPTALPIAEAPARLSITQVAQEPKVKRSVKPSIPLGLQSMLRSPSRTPIVIPVKVRIDPFGRVTSAQADYPQGSVFEKQLVNLVQSTARYWSFDPATINGKPVASELVINFKF